MQANNYRVHEHSDGQWTRFEKTKQYPIAELGWDSQRESLAVHLWLPFTTINGSLNRKRYPGKYDRTAMMRLWIENGNVPYLGYVHNSRRRWIVVTIKEIRDDQFSIPTKLSRYLKCRDGEYYQSTSAHWKGLAMPLSTYQKIMDITELESSYQSLCQKALDYSLEKRNQRRSSKPTAPPD